MTQRAFYVAGTTVFALAICLHLLMFARGFYSIGWDESGRTLDAYGWTTHGIVSGTAWLPFYRVCMGLALKLHPDLFLTPRIVTFLVGLASMAAAGWLAHELFAQRTTTLLTVTLAAFLPQRVALSLAPLSDIMFALAILAALAALARWLRSSDPTFLFACALLTALAETIRYEGWIFAMTLSCVIAANTVGAARRIEPRILILLGAILVAFPVWWGIRHFAATNPIAVVVTDARNFSSWQLVRKNPLVELVVSNVATLNAIGVLAILHFIRRGPERYRMIIAASFAPLAVVSAGLIVFQAAQTGPSWRMIGVWSMLLLPFTAYVLAGGPSPSPRRRGQAALTLTTVMVIAAFVYGVFRLERESTWAFPQSDRRAGEYLNDLITAAPGTRILIESSTYIFLNVQVAAQHPDAFVRNSVPERESTAVLPTTGPVADALAGRGIDILVFRSDDYTRLLDRRPGVTKLEQFGGWSIYRLTH